MERFINLDKSHVKELWFYQQNNLFSCKIRLIELKVFSKGFIWLLFILVSDTQSAPIVAQERL